VGLAAPLVILAGRHPLVNVYSNLYLAHLFVFKHWVIHLINERKSISSIQRDLLPLLVKNQDRVIALANPDAAASDIAIDAASNGTRRRCTTLCSACGVSPPAGGGRCLGDVRRSAAPLPAQPLPGRLVALHDGAADGTAAMQRLRPRRHALLRAGQQHRHVLRSEPPGASVVSARAVPAQGLPPLARR